MMFQCRYEPTDDGYQCKDCGHTHLSAPDQPPPFHDCLRSPDLVPLLAQFGLPTDLASPDLSAAILRWHYLGRPERSDADVAQLKATCEACKETDCTVRSNAGLLRLGTWYCFHGTNDVLARYAAGQPLGPGDWLHIEIIRWIGESPTRQCGCQDRINQMNAWGVEGCREHLDEIVGWLMEEAQKHGWWKYAVVVPGSRYFIKQMVLGAIGKAERFAP